MTASAGAVAKTVVLGSPPELTEWLARRRALGQDRLDEMWEGEYHVAPAPRFEHGQLVAHVLLLLTPRARAAGLIATAEFNLGTSPQSYRVPDAGFHAERPAADTVFVPTAAIVVEVLSPHDETPDKLPYYAQRGVREVVVVDPERRRVEFLLLDTDGRYRAVTDSVTLRIAAEDLVRQIEWLD